MLTDQIYGIYSKKLVLVVGLLALLNAVILMGIVTPALTLITGSPTPDVLWGYDVQTLQAQFEKLAQGDATIVYLRFIADSFFPFLYTFLISLLMVPLQRGIFKEESKWHSLVLLPFVAAVLDYTENVIVLQQFLTYPSLNAPIIAVSSLATQLKWIVIGVALIVLICEGIVYRFLRSRE